MKQTMKTLALILTLGAGFLATGYALEFKAPDAHNSVLGGVQQARVGWEDNFHTIGRRFDIGYDAMASANPEYQNKDLPLFYHVLIPSKFILPNTARKGIVINVAEKRLFYYDRNTNEVLTFPVGIGKVGWGTPLGTMHIVQKIKNPSWYAPRSILKALAKEGFKNVPSVIHHGPRDPLGDYAMRLSRPMYLIHGTDDPASIGTQASSGCIRLFAENIDQLFHSVPKGTRVRIVDEPYLLGWNNKQLYLVVYPGLEHQKPVELSNIQQAILKKTHDENANINWRTVAYAVLNKSGIPTEIATVA